MDIDKSKFPNIGNNKFYSKEFSVCQMLPQVPLENEEIEDDENLEEFISDRYTTESSGMSKSEQDKYNAKFEVFYSNLRANILAKYGLEITRRIYYSDKFKSLYQKFVDGDRLRNNPTDPNQIINKDLYIFSDIHVGKYMHEDNELLKWINQIPEDGTMLILGDIVYAKDLQIEHIKKFFNRVRCKNRYMLLGNHDVLSLDFYYDELNFKGIYDFIEDTKHKILFTHQPVNCKADWINIHGHLHDDTPYYSYLKYINKKINVYYKFYDKPKNLGQILGMKFKPNMNIIESTDTSKINTDFKKVNNLEIEYLNIHSPEAKKYLIKNNFFSKNFKKIYSITNGEIAIDKKSDKIAGYIYVGGGKKDENRNYGFIQTLKVVKPYRGYGISNRLLEDAIKKYNAVDLVVYKDNKIALNLYKKHGFVIIGYGNTNNKSDYWMKLKSKLSEDDKILQESSDVSKIDSTFKKKNGINFKYIDINDSSVSKYIKTVDSLNKNIDYIKKNKCGEIAVDTRKDTIAGYVLVTKRGDLSPLHVIKEYRGYGLSNYLMTDAINKYNCITLGVYDDNQVAIKLYKKFGFKQYRTKMYKDGSTVLFMKLDKKGSNNMNESFDIADSVYRELFCENTTTKGGDPKIPDQIEGAVSILEGKGYKVKYSSPGYTNTKFNNDKNKDGVVNNKLTSTGRIIFSRDYKFTSTPKGWEWRALQNGVKALYVKPITYNLDKEPDTEKAFQKWKGQYMEALNKWATALPQCGTES